MGTTQTPTWIHGRGKCRATCLCLVRHGRRGNTLVGTLFFIAFVLVPLLVLATGIGRYLHVQNALSAAADAAALAAAQDVDMRHFRETGEIRFAGYAWDEAYGYAMQNAEWMIQNHVFPRITHVHLHHERHVVEITVGADVTDLFGGIGPIWIERTAEAEVASVNEIYP